MGHAVQAGAWVYIVPLFIGVLILIVLHSIKSCHAPFVRVVDTPVDEEVEECWKNFWEPAVEADCGYLPDLGKIKKELADARHVYAQVPKVYMEVTGGAMSKANYYAEDVIAQFEDYVTGLVEEKLREMVKGGEFTLDGKEYQVVGHDVVEV